MRSISVGSMSLVSRLAFGAMTFGEGQLVPGIINFGLAATHEIACPPDAAISSESAL